ncbi:hypothetical protein APSETT445_000154 [Aspergillus pseudonomiae]
MTKKRMQRKAFFRKLRISSLFSKAQGTAELEENRTMLEKESKMTLNPANAHIKTLNKK